MKAYIFLTAIVFSITTNCSRKKDSAPEPETDAQKAAKIAYVSYSEITTGRNNLGVWLSIPITVNEPYKLKEVRLYIKGNQKLWSKSNITTGRQSINDQLTDWTTTKTQTYNFEYTLTDGAILKLENFNVTP